MREIISLPKLCYIEVTTRCNLKCRICGQTLYPGPRGDMPLETFNKLEPIYSRTEEVTLFGAGEPFIHPNYFEMLERVKAYNNRVNIGTNGTFLDTKTCLKIVKEGVDSLGISVDGACSETFNYIRRGADFDRVIENIRRLVAIKETLGSKKPHITLNLVATRLNLPELPDLVRLAHDLKADGIFAVPLIEWDLIKDEKIKAPESGIRYIEQAKELAEELNIRLHVSPSLIESIKDREEARQGPELPMDTLKGPRRKLCSEPWDVVQIECSGNVRPCCFPSRILGNINKEDFLTIWNSPDYNEFRRKLRSEHPPDECLKCAARPWSAPIPPKLDMETLVFGQLGTGWYDTESSPDGITYRWMGERAGFYIHNERGKELRINLFSNKLCLNPALPIDIYVNGDLIQKILLKKAKLQEAAIDIKRLPKGLLEVELLAANTFIPADSIPGSSDRRELSVALCSARLA